LFSDQQRTSWHQEATTCPRASLAPVKLQVCIPNKGREDV
jgi:hypothetical protein